MEELKNCIQILKSESLQPTILYEALSPLSNSSNWDTNLFYSTMYINILCIFVLGKILANETSGNSRSTSPTDNGVTKFTPTGLYFLPESVKLLSPLIESQQHGSNS